VSGPYNHPTPGGLSPENGSHEALSASVPVQVLEHAVVLDATAAADVAGLVAAGLRACSMLDGIQPPLRLRALAEQLRHAATEVRSVPRPRSVERLIGDTMTVVDTKEAARMLGVSARHVRRLAPRLGAERVHYRWQLDPVAVQAHRIRRQESK
jgi:hypothetical protein